MSRWVRELRQCQERYGRTVLVTVVSTRGSTPRDTGARMMIHADGILGTIGGGHLELRAIEIAREMLASGKAPARHRFKLGASLGQCCGGGVDLLFQPVLREDVWVAELACNLAAGVACSLVTIMDECRLGEIIMAPAGNVPGGAATLLRDECGERLVETVNPGGFHVHLFGAGHVGRALVGILGELDCTISWFDNRESAFPVEVPCNASVLSTDDPAGEVAGAGAGDYFVVMTHDHMLDQAICEAILRREDFGFLGLIGSVTKRALFEKRLSARGVPQSNLARMTCPVGDLTVRSKLPMAIAMGVAAQLQRQFEAGIVCPREDALPKPQHETLALARLSSHFCSESRASA